MVRIPDISKDERNRIIAVLRLVLNKLDTSADFSVLELADLTGVSKQRLYQLRDRVLTNLSELLNSEAHTTRKTLHARIEKMRQAHDAATRELAHKHVAQTANLRNATAKLVQENMDLRREITELKADREFAHTLRKPKTRFRRKR